VEDMVRQSHSSAKKFIISNVTQLVERRQVWRAVPVAPRAIQHRVDALAVWRFNKRRTDRNAMAITALHCEQWGTRCKNTVVHEYSFSCSVGYGKYSSHRLLLPVKENTYSIA